MALSKPSPSSPPAENYRRIAVAFEVLDLNTSGLSTLQTNFSNYQIAVGAALAGLQPKFDLAALQASVSSRALNSSVTALSAIVTAHDAAILATQQALGTEITARGNAIIEQAALRVELANRTTGLEGRVTEHSQVLSAHTSEILATQGAVGSEIVNRQAAIQAEATSRQAAIQVEIGNRQAAVQGEANARQAGDAVLGLRIDGTQALVGTIVQHRPGDTPSAFTQSQAGGRPEALPPIPVSIIGTNENGRVAILTGQTLIARRRLDPIEAGRLYAAGWAFQRRTDTADPSGNTVRLGLFWFDQNGLALTGGSISTVVKDYDELRLADGRVRYTTTVARQAGLGAQIVAPAGARYARAFVFTFGFDQQTDIELIGWADVTDAQLFAPNVDGFDARLSTIEAADLLARTNNLESVTANPRILTFPTRADAIAASAPAGIRNIRLLGYNAPGDGGGGDYRRAASQPSTGVYFNTNDGAAWVFAGETICLQQAGGFDDGTACDAAWTRVKATGLVIDLPWLLSGVYTFASPLLLAGASANPDLGVSIIAPSADFSPTFKTTRSIPALFRVGDGDTQPYAYELTSDNKPTRRSKIIWPTHGDIDRDRFGAPDMTLLSHVTVANQTDNWATVTPNVQTAREVTWQLQPDNVIRASLLPVRGGQDVRWARSGGDYQGGFILRTTAGYYFMRAGLTGAAQMMTKLVGQPSTEFGAIGWPGIGTDGSYYAGNGYWGVRIYDNKTFGLLINGYLAFGPYPVTGEIIDAGPAFFGNQNLTVSASWMNRIFRSTAAGGILTSLLMIGDSTSEAVHGGMADVIAETLDGVRGIRVVAVNNYAKGGHSSADQLARLQTLGIPPNTTHATVLVGRNDISGGAGADGFSLGYITQILDILIAASIRVVLCVPFGAYGRAPAGGRGVNVVNAENSARTQMMIAALGATKGVKVVDLNEFSGPAIGELANHAFAPSMWRDNLHESALGYKVYGQAIANALAGLTLLPMTPDVKDGALPTTTLAGVYGPMNGWAPGSLPLRYSVRGPADFAEASLRGILLAGSRSPQQLVYQLPPNLRPLNNIQVGLGSDKPGAQGLITTSGNVFVLGLEVDGAQVSLNGFRYPLA